MNKSRQRSPHSSPGQGLRYTLRVCFVSVFILLFVEGTSQTTKEDVQQERMSVGVNKRPARLSYFRPPSGGGYNRGRSNMPWDSLPNTNCLRSFCRSDDDCCRRYSKCNTIAQVCYDCWYGHPCNTNKDCCKRYPSCNLSLHTCV